ncbi:MAG: hypothetical protein L3K16_00645 [Thermoplasmata archaeon]|nr:hypothetical protein [Thermoplasmata archaeon]
MRKGLVVVGVVLLIIGVLAAGLTFQLSQSANVPAAPSAETATMPTLEDGSVTVSWSGGTAATVLGVFSGTGCTNGPAAPLASGSGASGSVTVSVTSGTTYQICTTAGGPVSATIQTDGFGIFVIVGIVLAAMGAFLLVIGVMARPRTRAAPAEVDAATPAATDSTQPSDGSMSDLHAPRDPTDQGHIMQAAPIAEQAAQGNRAMIKCASCGTLNEPWLHNCRRCQRALTTTAESV